MTNSTVSHEDRNNAQLIADLLAALRNVVMNDDGSPIAHVMASIARTAIAKAEA